MPHLLPQFTSVLLRRPASSLAAGITSSAQLGVPDFQRALDQFETYIAALSDCGLELTILPADDRFPDGTLCRRSACDLSRPGFLLSPWGAVT